MRSMGLQMLRIRKGQGKGSEEGRESEGIKPVQGKMA
jgi:hypothetical protein